MQTAAIPPVRKTVRVAAPPARAFEIFTAGMHQWWPRSHSLHPTSERVAIVAEPRAKGRWFERTADGTECEWGHVLAWEPPHRVLFAWQLNEKWEFDPKLITEVEIRFEADGTDATQVTLVHGKLERFGVHAENVRTGLDSPDGWNGILAQFAQLSGQR